MKTKRIVISGGPGSGKTTLISHLESEGHTCMHEVSRAVIHEAQKQGIDQLFLTNPILFSQKLLEGRLQQFLDASKYNELPFIFYDRGMPDVTAYMDFIDSHYPENFSETCSINKYDIIFLLPPWEEIYTQDNERYESFEQAEKIYHFLLKGYQSYGYNVIEVPVGTVEDRIAYIHKQLKQLL
ncbi:AAA family ATPase [Ulvibacter litoralis]|uniref:Predicted ATPase n=1 Tax=Ulvibacter litoralis TaxID=227084 RepID=A0A1G7F693_9FLAO|nr:ATP-binding protein [Ulvibacter litoralis]GHC52537.1 ATPase [Ulvibacter litoralis]SDE71306.1 Predicted ATPase [Ulvibacter litoralis]